MIFLFSLIFFSKPTERGTECRPCTKSEFKNYTNCHLTGFILTHAKKDAIQACTPKLSKTYTTGFKISSILFIAAVNFILLSRLRQNCLLKRSYPE